jgi:hypothetical protein
MHPTEVLHRVPGPKLKLCLAILVFVFTMGAIESIYNALFEDLKDFRYDFLKQKIAHDARIQALVGADMSIDRSPSYHLYDDSARYWTTATGEKARVHITAKFIRSGKRWVLQDITSK